MLPFIPVFVLLLAAILSGVLFNLKLKFTHYWLLAVISAILAWIIMLISKIQIPSSSRLLTWKPAELFPVSPSLQADNTAWMFSVAITTITLCTILIEATRRPEEISADTNFFNRIALFVLSSLSILGVLAGNILTLLFIWALLDISETIIWLRINESRHNNRRFIFNTFIRLISLVLLVFAAVISISYEMYPGFSGLSAPIFLLITFAAGLRFVVLLGSPIGVGDILISEYASIMRMIPMAASLIILVRLADASIAPNITTVALAAAGIISIMTGLLWISRESAAEGLPFWMMSVSALVFASSILGKSTASLTWGITTLISAGLIALFHTRRRWAGYFLFFGLLNLSSLPFFASWEGVLMYSPPSQIVVYIFLIVQGLFTAGYYRLIRNTKREKLGAERWILLMYPFSLALLPVTHYILAFFGDQAFQTNFFSIPGQIFQSWPGVMASLLAVIFWLLNERFGGRISRSLSILNSIFSLDWLYRIIKYIYTVVDRSLSFGNAIFEGRGGIFWSILLLVLVIAVVIQT